jgi:hypothetical protein
MDKQSSPDKESQRFRAEAKELLGLVKPAEAQKKKD